jgi:dGTPase
MEACHSAHDAVLPDDRREELEAHGDILRACADHVASLTERQAEAAYRRLFGFDMGAITDAI